MKTSYLLAIPAAFAGLLFLACSSDSSSGGGPGSDAGATADGGAKQDAQSAADSAPGTDSAVADSSPSDGAPSDGPSGEGGAKLDCPSYCSEVLANCTGANAQFSDMPSCLGFCAGYPKGALGDMSGNTLGCRLYHGGAPSQTNPTLHCPHAGPTGGDKDPKGTTGVCGEPCDAFCATALIVCAGKPSAYTDLNACLTECKTFAVDTASYSTADTTKNDMGCRVYHLTAASASAAAATTHCPHIRAVSPVCTQ